MAKMLRVNGIECHVLSGSASHKPNPFHDDTRAEDGTLLFNRQTIKESFRFTIAHRTPSEAIAWRQLLMGEGQVWNFDTTAYSSKGVAPTSLAFWSIGATAKYGAGALQLTALTGSVVFPAIVSPLKGGNPRTSIAFWRRVGAGAFQHILLTSDGDAFVNGSLSGSPFSTWGVTFTSATGVWTLAADAASTTYIDDVVIVPFVIPSTWVADWYGYGSAFSQLAQLFIDGDLVDANLITRTVIGKVSDVLPMMAYSGAFYQSLRTLEVELEEV